MARRSKFLDISKEEKRKILDQTYIYNIDIQKIAGIGYSKAKLIIDEIQDEMEKSFYKDRVPVKRVLEKLGLTMKDF